jgi:quinol-cytochrome oxidoreductase complex cytochrome b subunit
VILHVWALHVVGQNNPTGVEIKSKADTLPFTPYATVKDGLAIIFFLLMFSYFVFFNPEAFASPDNSIPANPLQTPNHIVPEWYLLPFYAMLRAIPDKFGGVIVMFSSIAVLFILPWIDTSKVRSMRYRPVSRWFFIIFILVCFGLGWCGAQLPDDLVFTVGQDAQGEPIGMKYVLLSQILTVCYFGFFASLFFLGFIEEPLPVPASISEAVLASHAKKKG